MIKAKTARDTSNFQRAPKRSILLLILCRVSATPYHHKRRFEINHSSHHLSPTTITDLISSLPERRFTVAERRNGIELFSFLRKRPPMTMKADVMNLEIAAGSEQRGTPRSTAPDGVDVPNSPSEMIEIS